MSKMVSFRFPEELLERVDSARGEEPRSKYVIRAIYWTLNHETIRSAADEAFREAMAEPLPPRSIPCEEVKQMAQKAGHDPATFQGRYESRGHKHAVAESGVPDPARPALLRCPSSGCDFQAPSPNARCPRHGRTVR